MSRFGFRVGFLNVLKNFRHVLGCFVGEVMLRFGCEFWHRIFQTIHWEGKGRGGRLFSCNSPFPKVCMLSWLHFSALSVCTLSLVLPYFFFRTFDVLSVACCPIYFYSLLVDQQAKKLRCSRLGGFKILSCSKSKSRSKLSEYYRLMFSGKLEAFLISQV